MRTANHDRWTEKYAREVLKDADRRKLSITALARELGVSPQRIHWWRKRLQETQTASTPTFVEIKLAATSPQPQMQPFALRTRNGRMIDVWPGFDAAELARLIAAVEATC